MPADRPGDYFTWTEFSSASSARLTKANRAGIRVLCRVYLDPMRRRFGTCFVHSARRNARHNRRIGGAWRSYHVYSIRPGHAVADVSFARGTPEQWAAYARSLGPTWSDPYLGHVHVDTRDLL